jgi:hypothetical protein
MFLSAAEVGRFEIAATPRRDTWHHTVFAEGLFLVPSLISDRASRFSHTQSRLVYIVQVVFVRWADVSSGRNLFLSSMKIFHFKLYPLTWWVILWGRFLLIMNV